MTEQSPRATRPDARPRTARQVPRWSELRPLLRAKPVQLDPTERRLERALSIADLRRAARRRTPRSVFDYTDGAADAEISLRRARSLFRQLELRPSILHDVSAVDTTAPMLGRGAAVPFAFAPTGFTRMMHHEGETAVVRVAGRRGIPYALSTMGTTSIEDVAAASPEARKWFQLYVGRTAAPARSSWRARGRPATRPSCSRSTSPWRARGCATCATASPSRPR